MEQSGHGFELAPAALGRRLAARAIDAALLSPPLLWAQWQARGLGDGGLGAVAVWVGLALLALTWVVLGWAVYDTVAIRAQGATVGKRALGLAVVRVSDGGRPSWGQLALRSVTSTVVLSTTGALLVVLGGRLPLLPLALAAWWVADITRGRQPWYDRRAGTVVVRRRMLPEPPARAVPTGPLAGGSPHPWRAVVRAVVVPAVAAAYAAVPLWATARDGRLLPALAVLGAGVVACAAAWQGPRRLVAGGAAGAVAVGIAVLLVGQLPNTPARASARLAAELQAAGFEPLPPGVRGEHCHRGWANPDACPPPPGPELRRAGSLEDAVAAVVTAARAAGLGADGTPVDPFSNRPGHRSLVVRAGRTLLVVSITTAASEVSTVPPGQVAVWWSAR